MYVLKSLAESGDPVYPRERNPVLVGLTRSWWATFVSICLSGLAGFARLCAGDQYEVSPFFFFIRFYFHWTDRIFVLKYVCLMDFSVIVRCFLCVMSLFGSECMYLCLCYLESTLLSVWKLLFTRRLRNTEWHHNAVPLCDFG